MDEGRERGEVLVNPDILGPNRRPAHVRTYTATDHTNGWTLETPDRIDAVVFLGSRSEH